MDPPLEPCSLASNLGGFLQAQLRNPMLKDTLGMDKSFYGFVFNIDVCPGTHQGPHPVRKSGRKHQSDRAAIAERADEYGLGQSQEIQKGPQVFHILFKKIYWKDFSGR